MKRRTFVTLAGLAAAWPISVRAQQAARPIIGLLSDASASARRLASFQSGLREAGYVDGQNVSIEQKWAGGRPDRLPELAAELVKKNPVVIATAGPYSVLAARAVAGATPITFQIGSDPVAAGLVDRINRPGGNVTGITVFANNVQQKRFDLLRKAMPNGRNFGYLFNPTGPSAKTQLADIHELTNNLGNIITVIEASNATEIDAAFERMQQLGLSGVVVAPNTVFIDRGKQIADLALRYSLPTTFELREAVEAGGLMSYGPNFDEIWRQSGRYVGRILNGEKPGDLPVLLPTKFDFVINLKTARVLGLEIPSGVLAIADEVIE